MDRVVGVKNLNKEQLEAVKHKKGPLLIIAGAGTGKTTVITERIKYLIEKEKVKPSEILALTFTHKAAREMEERVDIALPFGYTQMWISTFHSFCDRILRREALHIGLDPKFKLMTQATTIQLIRDNLFEFELDYFRPLGNPTKFVAGMLQHFSRLQDEDIFPQEYLKWAKKKAKSGVKRTEEQKLEIQKWLELANAYKTYDDLKTNEGLMDFGDLIINTLLLFRKRKNVLTEYNKQFKYVLVDEFQDTNYAQNELAILLAGKKKNITVTGDDDQSIYRFRGAAVSNIIQFRQAFPRAKVVVLTRNYRTYQGILDKAYELIQFNNPDRLEVVEKVDKKLEAQRKKGEGEVFFIHKDRVENEADEVAKKASRLVKSKDYDYKDIAVLVRANNHSDPFVRAFQRHGIPYQFLGPGKLFKQSEIIDMISYLKVLYNPDDNVAFYRLLSFDIFDISGRDLVKITNYAKWRSLTLYEALMQIKDIYVTEKTKTKVGVILKTINKHLNLAKKETAGQLLYYFLEETGLLKKMLDPDSNVSERKVANVSKFFDKIKTYETEHEDASVRAVVDWINLASELGESPLATDTDWTEVNAVNILTAHSAKGLEFPIVFLVNLVSQRFPTIERREQIPIPEKLIKEVLPEGDYHMQEERRLFYVGMTRAKDKLFLTAANYYGEAKREKKLSPFIFEALGDDVTASEQVKSDGEQLSIINFKTSKDEDLSAEQKLPVHIDYLSYSQIQTFRICPLHYKLKYILKIPTPATSSQSFGNSFHITMKAFYDEIQKGNKPTKRLMYKLLEENWINEGYLSKAHERKSFEKAKKFLDHYLDHTFDPRVLPIATEQPFLIKLNPPSQNASEGRGRLKVGGKIDRIDVRGKTVEIIDYKTGAKALSQKEADKDMQLSIYALAATMIPEPPFNRKIENVKLSFYYFDTPQIVTTTRTKEDLIKAKEEVEDYKKQIEKSDFECSRNYLCEKCEYSFLCKVDK